MGDDVFCVTCYTVAKPTRTVDNTGKALVALALTALLCWLMLPKLVVPFWGDHMADPGLGELFACWGVVLSPLLIGSALCRGRHCCRACGSTTIAPHGTPRYKEEADRQRSIQDLKQRIGGIK